MKNLLIIVCLLGCLSAYGQKEAEICNQLPYARVDVKAKITNDIDKIVQSSVPTSMEKGEFSATFKFYVDCKGAIEKHRYTSGNLDTEQEKWLTSILGKATIKTRESFAL